MNEKVYFYLASSCDVAEFASPRVLIKCNDCSLCIGVAEVEADEIVFALTLNKSKWMNTIEALASCSIIILIRLTISPHVPCAFFETKLMVSLSKAEDVLRRKVEVHLDELVHENKRAFVIINEFVSRN